MKSPESSLIRMSRKVMSPNHDVRKPSWSGKECVEDQARISSPASTRSAASAARPNTSPKCLVVGSEVGAHDGYVQLPPVATAVIGGPPELGIFELPYLKALAVEAADVRRLHAADPRLLGRDETNRRLASRISPDIAAVSIAIARFP